MSKNTGGNAFPIPGLHQHEEFNGMTLRDYFASQAITAAMTTPWSDVGYKPADGLSDIQQHARLAYQIADAMIAERAK